VAPVAHDLVVGREPELAAAEAFADGLRDGPRGLLIEGAPGIGKTAVWRAVVQAAEARGCRVLRSVAEQAEARLCFVGLGDLAGALEPELLAALPAPQREALEVALVRRASGARAPDPMAVAVGLRSLFVRAAESAPLLVAVDDLQWLDAATARALAFAVRRLEGRRIGLVATLRAPVAEPDPLGLQRALGADRVARARLGPLDAGAVRRLVEARLGYAWRRPVLQRVVNVSGGNPMFALELAHALGPAPVLPAGAPLPVPESLREIVARRIAAVPAHARASLLTAAALAQPTAGLVERASSPAGLIAAEESGLLTAEGERLVFAHPLYASAVYAAAASGRRRALHRRLAALVADPEERARHRALAAARPDERVAEALEQAADAARGRGAWETAGELLEQAQALTPPARPEAARRRSVRAAEHHIHAGDRPRARALLDAILAGAPPGPIRSDALRLLAEVLYNGAGFAEAAPLLEEALEHAGDPGLAATIELDLCYVRCNLHADHARADVHAGRALAHARRAGDPTLLGAALAARAMVDYLVGRGIDWAMVEQARALEGRSVRPVPLYLRPSATAACLKLWVGRYAEARAELTALRLAAVDSGDESDLAYLLTWCAALETLSGDLSTAAALAGEAAAHAALAGSEINRAWALAQRATVHAYRGDADAAQADAAVAHEICVRFEAPLPLLWVAAALGTLHLGRGDAAAAWAVLAPAADALRGEAFAIALLPAIEALVALGQLDEAQRRLDRLEPAAEASDRVWARAESARCRALLLAARGDLAGAHAATERSLAQHARIDTPFERARTLLVRGQIARRRRQKRAAREALDGALAAFEALGARVWAQRAREDLGRLGKRRSDVLTPSEGRVAELVAQGMSNKEIARALFVTVHTVEVHLSHAYAKLGVRSRTQLAGRIAAAQV
jgi:DNA-binding CsgD family transcriptional regulator